MTATRLVDDFLDHRVNPGAFGHREHVFVAWHLLERFSFDHALRLFALAATDLATRAGAPEKFHITLTKALLQIIGADRAENPAQGWEDYLASEPAVLSDPKSLMACHYTAERLFCDTSRREWREPDLAPLPIPKVSENRGAA